jgi:hypothetical protein
MGLHKGLHRGYTMRGYRFITLHHTSTSGTIIARRFMVGNIVTWAKPMNGKGNSCVITNEGGDDGWYVNEPPEVIDMMIEALS